MSACACMGPPGNCPCIRMQRGEKLEITEITIAPALFACLSDKDKNTINDLKTKALGLWMERKSFLASEPSKYDLSDWRSHTQKETP